MKITTRVALIISVIPSLVTAHGYLGSFAVDGREFPAFAYWNQDTSGPVRVTDYLEPLYNVWSREFACGRNARRSTGIATVRPGSRLHWGWRTDTNKNWVHFEGTSRTFIASCNGNCATADETQLDWWELTSLRKGKWDNGQWPVKILNDGGRWEDVLPGGIPNGDYLVRNELTALHYSMRHVSEGGFEGHGWGTEFYPTCVAVRMVDSGGGQVPSQVFRLPGAFNTDQPGHYLPEFWTRGQFQWAEPVNTFTGTSGHNVGNNGNNGNNQVETPASPAPNPPEPEQASGGGGNEVSNGSSSNDSPPPPPVTTTIPSKLCKRRRRKRDEVKRAVSVGHGSVHRFVTSSGNRHGLNPVEF